MVRTGVPTGVWVEEGMQVIATAVQQLGIGGDQPAASHETKREAPAGWDSF
jgi:hypothetical protein